MGQNSQPDFDSVKQVNEYGTEYWSGRDLMPLLGYTLWQNFNYTIKRAKASCGQSGNVVADHFIDINKMVIVGSDARRRVKDYNLSRFACYLIAQNGDPRKPEIAAAQTYFAIATRQYELRELADRQRQRVELREGIIEGHQTLTQAAAQVGVQTQNFGTFHNAGYKGLYGGLEVEQIKKRKGIEADQDLLDHAGLAELGANALRIGLTEEKLRSGDVTGETQAVDTHHEIGQAIRGTIEKLGGTMPEDLPIESSVRPLLQERQHKREKPKPEQLPER